jgi:hypothetical protein
MKAVMIGDSLVVRVVKTELAVKRRGCLNT